MKLYLKIFNADFNGEKNSIGAGSSSKLSTQNLEIIKTIKNRVKHNYFQNCWWFCLEVHNWFHNIQKQLTFYFEIRGASPDDLSFLLHTSPLSQLGLPTGFYSESMLLQRPWPVLIWFITDHIFLESSKPLILGILHKIFVQKSIPFFYISLSLLIGVEKEYYQKFHSRIVISWRMKFIPRILGGSLSANMRGRNIKKKRYLIFSFKAFWNMSCIRFIVIFLKIFSWA